MNEQRRETSWLIERNGTYATACDGPFPSWSNDPWRAHRFTTHKDAEDARLLFNATEFRNESRPVEHLFIYAPPPAEDEYDDEIGEALDDAVSDGEGHLTARYVRRHLAKRGLRIVPTNYFPMPAEGASPDRKDG